MVHLSSRAKGQKDGSSLSCLQCCCFALDFVHVRATSWCVQCKQTATTNLSEKQKTTFTQIDLLWVPRDMQPCITFGMQRKASVFHAFLQPSSAAWTLVHYFLLLLPVCRCAGVSEVAHCINCHHRLLSRIRISHPFQDSSAVVEIFHQLQTQMLL